MPTLWLSPSGAVEIELRSMIERYAVELDTPSFAPHVTLLGGWSGELSADPLLSGLTPFVVPVQGVASSPEFFRSVVIELALTPELSELRRGAERAAGVSGVGDYRPHLSVVYGEMPARNRDRVRLEVGRDAPRSVRLDRLQVVDTVGPVERWRVLRTFEF